MVTEPSRRRRRPEVVDLPQREEELAGGTHWPLLLTPRQFARYVGLGECTIREAIQLGLIAVTRVPVLTGHKQMIKRSTADAWVAGLTEEASRQN